jgi:hypothetical protein
MMAKLRGQVKKASREQIMLLERSSQRYMKPSKICRSKSKKWERKKRASEISDYRLSSD